MKEIRLTKGMVTLVDDEDFEYLNQWKWCASKPSHSKTYYVLRGEWMGNGKTRPILMHRVIMKTPKELTVDHIDHNGLNNQKSNLRNCTFLQNKVNRNSQLNSKSIYLGVNIYQGRIRAQITINGKRFHLGYFKSEEEAAKAYDTKALESYGEFANLNFKIN